MDDEIMQITGSESGDGFLEGWEETNETETPDDGMPGEAETPDDSVTGEADRGAEGAPDREEPAGVPAPAPEPLQLDGRAMEWLERQRQRTREDVREFRSVFPEAARNYQNIPQEVWDAVRGGMSLVAAYSRYHNAQEAARAQAQAEEWQRQEAVLRRNAENAARSAGSMRSAGSGHGPRDPFLEGWDEN